MTAGRNDLCPCGSDKKLKKCCLNAKPVDCGPCAVCTLPSVGARQCTLCGKVYAHCPSHAEYSQTSIAGHVLRVHPESIADDQFAKLMADREALDGIRSRAEAQPELWAKLLGFMDAWSAKRREGMQ